MKKIKPIAKKHRFTRWLKRLLGIQSPSAMMRGFRDIDEMHELKADIDFTSTITKKEPRYYYVRAEVIGELPSGQVRVRLLANGTDGYNFFTERRYLISEGQLFVKIPVDKPCPKCGHIDRYLGSICEPQSVSMEIIEIKEEPKE